MRLLGADMHDYACTHLAQRRDDRRCERQHGFDPAVRRDHDYNAEAGTSDVLLVFQIAVHRDQHVKAGLCTAAQKLTILDPRPV